MEDEVVLAQVTLHPQALDRHELYWNAYRAVSAALREAYGTSNREVRGAGGGC